MIRSAIIAVLICGGCATGKAARIKQAAQPAPARNQQTAEERLAAQRAADPRLKEEDNEARWGHAQAEERKQQQQQAAAPPANKSESAPQPGPGDVKKSDPAKKGGAPASSAPP